MIKEDGYEGGEGILRSHVAKVRPPKHTAYLTLNFAPGESAQVDFGYCGTIQVGEESRRLYVFMMTLCYSRMIHAEFILRQNTEHFLQSHRNAFEYFGGVPEKMMVDNCKVAVSDASKYGSPVINPHYADLASHYNFKVVACGVRKPYEKGIVERGIGYLKKNFLNGLEKGTLAALNHAGRNWMENVANVRIHGVTKKQPAELFKAEKNEMKSLPLFPYDCCVTHNVRVNSQYRVVFESNRYSVPPELVRHQIEMKVYPGKLCFAHQNKLVGEHERSYEKHKGKITLPALAKFAGMSKSSLHMNFLAAIGIPPVQYLIRTRMEKAAELLRNSNANVTEAAFASGFNDSNYFVRQFRKHFGITPGKFRHMHQTGKRR